MADLILPSAKLGVIHRLGEIMTTDMQSGVLVFVRDDKVVQQFRKGGAVVFEIEYGEKQMAQMADFFRRGVDMIQQQGGSGLPETKIVAGQRG